MSPRLVYYTCLLLKYLWYRCCRRFPLAFALNLQRPQFCHSRVDMNDATRPNTTRTNHSCADGSIWKLKLFKTFQNMDKDGVYVAFDWRVSTHLNGLGNKHVRSIICSFNSHHVLPVNKELHATVRCVVQNIQQLAVFSIHAPVYFFISQCWNKKAFGAFVLKIVLIIVQYSGG